MSVTTSPNVFWSLIQQSGCLQVTNDAPVHSFAHAALTPLTHSSLAHFTLPPRTPSHPHPTHSYPPHPTYPQGAAFAAELGVPFIECSSKTGENVGEAFSLLLSEVERELGSLEVVDPSDSCDWPQMSPCLGCTGCVVG